MPIEDEGIEPVPSTHIGKQIRAIRDLLGSVRKELSYEGLADELATQASVSISGAALRTYEVGDREPPLSVVEGLAKIDPRGYTPAQIAGWEPLPAPTVDPAPRGNGPAVPSADQLKPAPAVRREHKRGA